MTKSIVFYLCSRMIIITHREELVYNVFIFTTRCMHAYDVSRRAMRQCRIAHADGCAEQVSEIVQLMIIITHREELPV